MFKLLKGTILEYVFPTTNKSNTPITSFEFHGQNKTDYKVSEKVRSDFLGKHFQYLKVNKTNYRDTTRVSKRCRSNRSLFNLFVAIFFYWVWRSLIGRQSWKYRLHQSKLSFKSKTTACALNVCSHFIKVKLSEMIPEKLKFQMWLTG